MPRLAHEQEIDLLLRIIKCMGGPTGKTWKDLVDDMDEDIKPDAARMRYNYIKARAEAVTSTGATTTSPKKVTASKTGSTKAARDETAATSPKKAPTRKADSKTDSETKTTTIPKARKRAKAEMSEEEGEEPGKKKSGKISTAKAKAMKYEAAE